MDPLEPGYCIYCLEIIRTKKDLQNHKCKRSQRRDKDKEYQGGKKDG